MFRFTRDGVLVFVLRILAAIAGIITVFIAVFLVLESIPGLRNIGTPLVGAPYHLAVTDGPAFAPGFVAPALTAGAARLRSRLDALKSRRAALARAVSYQML